MVGTFYNCIVYGNAAPLFANYYDDVYTIFNYCCTTPLATNGTGNITNEPAFVNPAVGDFHLLQDSPCIDAGTNLSAIITNDLDGNLRPLDGNYDGIAGFDMGAYEFNPDNSFRIQSISIGPPVTVHFHSATNRVYTLFYCTNLTFSWSSVLGQTDVPGQGEVDSLQDTNGMPYSFYRIGVKVP
jgi:hypothetical protein